MVLFRIRLVDITLCLMLLAVTSVIDESVGDESRLPNIILIVADDLGYGEVGCYGQKRIKTPSIDRLAQEGIRFTSFYAGSPVCAPSRCTLMTGKHTGHAYIRANGDPKHLDHLKKEYGWEFPGQNPIPESEVTIAEILKSKGYVTAGMGKWGLGHFGTTGDPNKQGFDLFYGFNCQRHAHNHYPKFLWRNAKKEPQPGNDRSLYGETYSQDQFVNEAIRFVRENKQQPFFLYLPFIIPHLGIQAPQASVDEYTSVIPEEDYQHRGYVKHPTPRAGYAAMVSHMDQGVGQITSLIDELGLAKDTIIIFTSDNGPTYDRIGGSDSDFFESSGPFRGRKGSVYEGGIRVPMVVRWPGQIAPNQETGHVSAFWDILPTLCEITGGQHPPAIDGLSFLPTLTGEGTQAEHEYLLWEFPSYQGQQALRIGRWKAVRTRMFQGNRTLELYDLQEDPGESKDVAGDHPQVVKKCEQYLRERRTDSELFPIFRNQAAKKKRNSQKGA